MSDKELKNSDDAYEQMRANRGDYDKPKVLDISIEIEEEAVHYNIPKELPLTYQFSHVTVIGKVYNMEFTKGIVGGRIVGKMEISDRDLEENFLGNFSFLSYGFIKKPKQLEVIEASLIPRNANYVKSKTL